MEVHLRVSPAERAAWKAQAAAAGVSLSALLRQAMARTGTAPALAILADRAHQAVEDLTRDSRE